MPVSKDKTAANATPADAELDIGQLDQVAGGDPVVTQTTRTNNQATTAQKQADKADSYIRS